MSIFGRTGHGELNGFLDAGSHLQGELTFEQTFRIEGRLTGKVVSDGDLIVGPKGELEGEVRVGRIVVTGTVRGEVHASRRVEIGSGGRVLGEIEAPVLVVEEGGIFDGRCKMGGANAEPQGGKVLARLPGATGAGPSELRGKVS